MADASRSALIERICKTALPYKGPIKNLVGRTFVFYEFDKEEGSIAFVDSDDFRWLFYNARWCSQSVTLEEVVGDLDSLLGKPLVRADMARQVGKTPDGQFDSGTWTFLRFCTEQDEVTLRFVGHSDESSEEPDLHVTHPDSSAAKFWSSV